MLIQCCKGIEKILNLQDYPVVSSMNNTMSCFIFSYNMTSPRERLIELRVDEALFRIEEHYF